MAEQASSRRGWLADSPLGIPAYRQLYTGAVTTSMAYTMQSAMAGWLMAGLSGSALLVGLVQAASTLPFLLFGLVSGSLSDVFDRRYILVFTHLMMGLATAAVGLMAQHGSLQPWSLVACTLLCGLGYTFYQPAQQASINGLVPRALLPKAVALGSVAFNAARSVGPALAGLIAATLGEGLAVMAATLFFLPMLPAALRALPPQPPAYSTGRETLWAGIRSGMRFAGHARVLRAALIVNFAFCFCAAALWAMFPLVAQQRLGLAADGYGFLYSTFGLGAVASALWLPRFLRQGPGAGRIVRGSLWFWSAASLTVGLSRWVPQAVVGTFLAGMAWVGVLAGLSTVAQSIAPAWVRARAVANNQISVQAGLALGSLFWGAVVNVSGLQQVLIVSAVLLAVFAVVARRLPVRLGTDEDVTADDFMVRQLAGRDGGQGDDVSSWPVAPSQPAAVVTPDGRCRVRVGYRVPAGQEAAFRHAMQGMRESRLRNGASRWQLRQMPAAGENETGAPDVKGAQGAQGAEGVPDVQGAGSVQGAPDVQGAQGAQDIQDAGNARGGVQGRGAADAGRGSVWEEAFLLPSAAEWQRFPERMTQADRIAFEGVLAVLAPAGGGAAGGGGSAGGESGARTL